MPRRKADIQSDFLSQEPPLMLPPVRTASPKHEHHYDAYETPPGAVPGKISNVSVTNEPITRKMTQRDLAERDQARYEQRQAAKRWNTFLDCLRENNGNSIQALAIVYDLPLDEVSERLEELMLDVRRGIGSTDVGRVMEKNSLDIESRARLLRDHAYGPVAAASIAALKIAEDMADDSGSTGSFEQFLRQVKNSK